MSESRNFYLDFLRGLVAINIVIIHTCFWSGSSYVPTVVQSLVLLLDVPFFFFLAGWSRGYSPTFKRTIQSLLNLYGKYVFFITFYFGILVLQSENGCGVDNYLAYLSFVNLQETKYFVVMGSIWFMPVYYTVVPFCMFVINGVIHAEKDYIKSVKMFLLICFILFIWLQAGNSYLFLGREVLFYSVFFLLGFLLKDSKIQKMHVFVATESVLLICAVVLARLMNIDILIIQSLKFPPHLIYMILSMLVIVAALFFKGKYSPKESNVFVWVGQNAIWFYFAQGISSTVIYKVVEHFSYSWYIKLPIGIGVNIILTITLVLLIRNLYRYVERLYAFLRKNERL